jgi:hypothetical protein
MKTIFGVVLALALAAGACSKVTYRNPMAAPSGVVVRTKGHFFLGGLVGHKVIPVYAMCPGGVAQIRSKYSFGDLFFHVITFFLYAPRTYTIACGQGGAP